MEIEGLQKRDKMESDFFEKEVSEVNRLGNEVKRLQSEKDELNEELKSLKNAPSPAATTQATYPPAAGTGASPGTPYGSLLLSHAQKLGQYSPSVTPYGMAAVQAAFAGLGGQALSYGSPQQLPPPPTHQYQGSPQQQQVAMALFQSPAIPQLGSPMAKGNSALSQVDVSTPVTTSASPTSSAGGSHNGFRVGLLGPDPLVIGHFECAVLRCALGKITVFLPATFPGMLPTEC